MYRTLETSIYDDERVRQLCGNGKLFFIYLITNRYSHVSGIYLLPDNMIRYNLGFSPRVLAGLWKKMAKYDLAYRDPRMDVVWVRRMLFYQGKGDKNARAAALFAVLDRINRRQLGLSTTSNFPVVSEKEKDLCEILTDQVATRIDLICKPIEL